MARVLVLEDEQVLRSSMVRGLGKLPGIVVDGTGTFAEALAAIDAAAPDLILSDLDLPDRSGIELVGELAARKLNTPIVYISAYLKAYGSQIPPRANVKVLEKPVELKELRELVLEHVGASDASADADSPFGLVDYIQLAAMGGHSVNVTLADIEGREGEVVVHRGQVWAAEDQDGEGRDALMRLLAMKPSTLQCKTCSGDPGPRSIDARWEELVLEAARIDDEAGRDTGIGDDALDQALDTAFDFMDDSAAEATDADASEPDDGFGDAMERGLEAMLAKDYPLALLAFEQAQAIRPDDRTVQANLTRLQDMGVGTSNDAGDDDGSSSS